MKTFQLIPGVHNSPETAYIQTDYPFGFQLRCLMRYWIEERKGKGMRLVTQTTVKAFNITFTNELHENRAEAMERAITAANAGKLQWNKPKAETYVWGLLLLGHDEQSHVATLALAPVWNIKEYLENKALVAGQLSPKDVNLTDAMEATSRRVNPVSWAICDTEAAIVANRLSDAEAQIARANAANGITYKKA